MCGLPAISRDLQTCETYNYPHLFYVPCTHKARQRAYAMVPPSPALPYTATHPQAPAARRSSMPYAALPCVCPALCVRAASPPVAQ